MSHDISECAVPHFEYLQIITIITVIINSKDIQISGLIYN